MVPVQQPGHAVVTSSLKLAFKIPYRVHFGQSLGLVGSAEALGGWEGSRAVRMTWSQGDLWIAEVEVDPQSAPAQLEYKYVVLNKDGHVSQWKPGNNYTLYVREAAARGGKRLTVSETWDEGLRVIELDGRMWDMWPGGSAGGASMDGSQPAGQPGTNGGHSNGHSDPQAANGNAASNGANGFNGNGSAASNGAGGPQQQQGFGGNGMGWPQPRNSGVSAIQLEAAAAMAELQEALERQISTLQRMTDPAEPELLMGDRILAAANLKAVTLNRALRAAQALPNLPPLLVKRGSTPTPS